VREGLRSRPAMPHAEAPEAAAVAAAAAEAAAGEAAAAAAEELEELEAGAAACWVLAQIQQVCFVLLQIQKVVPVGRAECQAGPVEPGALAEVGAPGLGSAGCALQWMLPQTHCEDLAGSGGGQRWRWCHHPRHPSQQVLQTCRSPL